MENHYNCIYIYTNKINGKRYVGQAVNFKQRHNQHINAITNKNHIEYNAPIQRAFRKYGLDNFEVEILKENLNTQCLLNIFECYYIKKYDLLCKNGKGYNLSDGGSNGNTIAGKTEEEIEEIRRHQSEAMKGKYCGENHPMYGKHISEETRQKISENHADMKGENHPRAKMVAQYDKQGNLIRVWDYIKQIEEELGINNTGICKCCKGKRKSAGGYIWRYVEETE